MFVLERHGSPRFAVFDSFLRVEEPEELPEGEDADDQVLRTATLLNRIGFAFSLDSSSGCAYY